MRGNISVVLVDLMSLSTNHSGLGRFPDKEVITTYAASGFSEDIVFLGVDAIDADVIQTVGQSLRLKTAYQKLCNSQFERKTRNMKSGSAYASIRCHCMSFLLVS
jgi:hypothetical protein